MSEYMKDKWMLFVGLALTCMFLWPLLDFAYCAIFVKSVFHYTVMGHIIAPLIFSAVFTGVDMLLDPKPIRCEC